MNKLLIVIEKLINAFAYLKIIASPTLIGVFIGIIIYSNWTNNTGLSIGILISLFGLVLGVLFAKWANKNGSAIDFISKVNASEDINEAVREDKSK